MAQVKMRILGRRTPLGARTTPFPIGVDYSGVGTFSSLPLVRDKFIQIHYSTNTRMGWELWDGKILLG